MVGVDFIPERSSLSKTRIYVGLGLKFCIGVFWQWHGNSEIFLDKRHFKLYCLLVLLNNLVITSLPIRVRTEQGEGNDVTDRWGVGQQHDETVDTDS